MAARSPPTGGLRRRRSRSSRRSSASPASRGRRTRRCRAAISPSTGVAALAAEIRALSPSCPPERAERLAHAYGTRARHIVGGARSEGDWGESFGADLTEREVRYLIGDEWARTAEDVLWRRSKLGLFMSEAEAGRLDAWMHEAGAAQVAAVASGAAP